MNVDKFNSKKAASGVGEVVTLSCKSCSYSQKVMLGFGFRYMYLSSILEWYEQEEGRQHIREFIGREDATFDCYNGIYVCEQCKYVLNRVFLELKSENHWYTNSYECPRCNSPMPTKPPLDCVESGELDCPECGETKLNMNLDMDWD
ncbi:hypothetical protein PAECIP112173_03648 [Paenibacillus sp. JJ-100]|uniref:hypothetical protein n=1 Tax=Paenibacillus sp. JJ-100 TaxID=2974896 RepID=UPI0022FF757A|nr:hypothetical protein [Paenibacillus sp. JJ-100]CAI6082667.1 hypothetical protein PAECIP112173_03648 [Paenibacillus sp. JJ-100]